MPRANNSVELKEQEWSEEARGMTLRALLLRLRQIDSTSKTLAVVGLDLLPEVFSSSGWIPAEEKPDAMLIWNVQIPENINARILLVTGPEQSAPPGYHEVFHRSLGVYTSLNAWFANLGRSLPLVFTGTIAALLRRTGVSGVVGSRMCKLRHPFWSEQLFLRDNEPDPVALRQSAGDRFRDLSMTFLGIGHTPLFAANTASLVATLLALGVFLALGWTAMQCALVVALVLSTAGCVAFEPWSARRYFTEDAREVVLDEVAGMSLTLLFLPSGHGLMGFIAAFIAFRIFDIFKPGIHWVEETGWRGTIVWDDVLAGIYAGLVVFCIFHFLI